MKLQMMNTIISSRQSVHWLEILLDRRELWHSYILYKFFKGLWGKELLADWIVKQAFPRAIPFTNGSSFWQQSTLMAEITFWRINFVQSFFYFFLVSLFANEVEEISFIMYPAYSRVGREERSVKTLRYH